MKTIGQVGEDLMTKEDRIGITPEQLEQAKKEMYEALETAEASSKLALIAVKDLVQKTKDFIKQNELNK